MTSPVWSPEQRSAEVCLHGRCRGECWLGYAEICRPQWRMLHSSQNKGAFSHKVSDIKLGLHSGKITPVSVSAALERSERTQEKLFGSW